MEIELKYAASPEQGKAILKDLSEGDSTKILIPSDIQNMAGLLTSLKESVK